MLDRDKTKFMAIALNFYIMVKKIIYIIIVRKLQYD